MVDSLANKLKDKLITLETTPGHSASINNIIESLEKYKLYEKVDGFSVTDNPLAKLKYSSFFAGVKLQERFNKPVIATMSMRDRNKIALQSDLLGANDFDIRNILALTGDSAKISDQPHTKGVFESNSNLLLDIINSFNCGIDYAGREFRVKPKKIYPFSVVNSYAKNFNSIKKKLYQKISHNSIAIITQPIFDIENGKKLIEIFEDVKKELNKEVYLILGFFPITKLKTAQFLSSHVPGIYVPQHLIDKLQNALEIDEEKVGFDISLKLFKDLQKLNPRIHIMTANKFKLAKDILDG